MISAGWEAMIADLIYDVGMHDGTDTDFYLKKGFRVVAIESNQELVAAARWLFADAFASCRLTVLNVAISDRDGVATFYRSPEHQGLTFSPTVLSTTDGEIADYYSRRFGAHFETIEVESSRFETILQQYGVPYYLKVDIEGADVLCVRALEHFSPRPRYLSIELPLLYPERHYKDLCYLYLLDYRWFKIIDQRFLRKLKLPSPAREGNYAPHEFAGHTSGPFGEETPGRWLSFEE